MPVPKTLLDIKGIGEESLKKFAVLKIRTIEDIIEFYPRKYIDYSHLSTIAHMQPGLVSIEGVIKQVKGRYVRRGMHITEAIVSDITGSVRVVWFNQPYREQSIKKNEQYYISGNYELRNQRYSIMNPSMELKSDFPINTARIVPIYKETKGLKSNQIRKTIKETIQYIRNIPESLPHWLIKEYDLMSKSKSVEMVHFPINSKELEKARYRLGFEEIFQLSIASLINKQVITKEIAPNIPFDRAVAQHFIAKLPFKITDDQKKCIWQIYMDIQKPSPMNRLIEGDVGSGKTVIAAMAALMVVEAKYQIVFLAPTELLARQHYSTLKTLFKNISSNVPIDLLIGSLKLQKKNEIREGFVSKKPRIIIGTHALLQDGIDYGKLGLIIIDEQHRFGVEQRKLLLNKSSKIPHILSMTATPIPRSLALTLYGELDISVIKEKPLGRLPVITKICSPNSKEQLYESIKKYLDMGQQMFVVCPLINESSMINANSAVKVYKELSSKDFKKYRVGLLHGKLKPSEKSHIMDNFINHKLDILVSTTVIEVGVDIPNATVMLIENGERFGLAQIHQLRGRVGRSIKQGYCFIMLSDSQPPSSRLRALERTVDGFELAELDLEIRGPGAIYGTSQHGVLDLRIAKLNDFHLISKARKASISFIDRGEDLLQYPYLFKRIDLLRNVTTLN
ncbi:MAG: ATP-dependent DNA helicase RecG [Candidatus Saccharimonadales bacterium]